MRKYLHIILTPLIFIFTYELLRLTFRDQLALFPTTSYIVVYFFDHLPRLLYHGWYTLREVLLGLSITVCLAFPLAWLMLTYQEVCRLFQSGFIIIQCIPMFTLAPVMVTIFGWTFMAILVPTIMMIIFPLTINIYRGFTRVPKNMLDYFAFHGASEWKTFTHLRVPYALPHIFSGLRISSAIAGIGAVAGEWAGAQQGLGVFMQETRRNFDLAGVFCGIFLLVAISLVLYNLVNLIERHRVCFEEPAL